MKPQLKAMLQFSGIKSTGKEVQQDKASWQRLKIKSVTYFLNKISICFQLNMWLT